MYQNDSKKHSEPTLDDKMTCNYTFSQSHFWQIKVSYVAAADETLGRILTRTPYIILI